MKKFSILLALLVAGVAHGATTFTTNYNFNKPGDGDRNYGSLIRSNWDKVDLQLKTNETSIADHLADTSAAHTALAVSTTVGSNICTTQTNVQDYLDCLDSLLDPSSSGVVLITGPQTITGTKTFSATPIFSGVLNGILSTDGTGAITSNTFSSLAPLTSKGDLMTFTTEAARLPIGTDGYHLEANSTTSEGMAWAEPNPKWRKFTFTSADLTAAATSFSVALVTLQAGEGIDAVVLKHTTEFAGGAITSYSVEVGVAGDTDKYSVPFNVFQPVGNTVRSINNVLDVPNFGTTTDVVITAKAVGANLDQASAGAVDVYLRTFKLP